MKDKLIRTIKAVSIKNKALGNIGFLTQEEENHWYNIKADESILDQFLDAIIQKGNLIEFEMENGFPRNFILKEKGQADKTGLKPKEKSGKWEDDMVTFEDLLTKAHEMKAPFSIKTEMLQLDVEKKYALFKAIVSVHGEGYSEQFEGHGDATLENVTGEFIKPHFIRMAETRSIVRALRWYTNNGCAEEEK